MLTTRCNVSNATMDICIVLLKYKSSYVIIQNSERFLQNGVYNAAQYLSMFILTMVVAVLADWLLEKKLIRVTPLRKIIQTFGR